MPENKQEKSCEGCGDNGCNFYGNPKEAVTCPHWIPRPKSTPPTEQKIAEAIGRINQVFLKAFDTNHPAMQDWVLVVMELKNKITKEEAREIAINTLDEVMRNEQFDIANILWIQLKYAINKAFGE